MAELSQLPDLVDLKFVAGDTFRIRVRVIDPDSSEPLALDLYGFAAEIARQPDRIVIAEFQYSIDPTSGDTAIFLTLPPEETAVLPSLGNGREFAGIWDLEVTFPNGDVRTVAKGELFCYIDITNSGDAIEP